jgi:pimeloyl-ACP methyl ester carboxylesterase
VNLGRTVDNKDVLAWTWSANTKCRGTPIVLIHGLGSGIGLWSSNLDSLCEGLSPVYALDLPGINGKNFKIAIEVKFY